MTKALSIMFIFLAAGVKGYSQINYSGKVETGYLLFQTNLSKVDPGPDWKGYYLENENGIDLNFINGLKFSDKFYSGIGLGYLNFEGTNGISVFADFDYIPLKTKLTPFVNLKVGYNHIWNQYEGGTGSASGELGLGINYKPAEQIKIYLQSGFLMTQQSLLIPVRIGFSF